MEIRFKRFFQTDCDIFPIDRKLTTRRVPLRRSSPRALGRLAQVRRLIIVFTMFSYVDSCKRFFRTMGFVCEQGPVGGIIIPSNKDRSLAALFQHVIQQRPNWISDFAAMAVDEKGCAGIIAVFIVATKRNFSKIQEFQLVNIAAEIKIKICCRNKDVVHIQ
jgi:hypothetical protein